MLKTTLTTIKKVCVFTLVPRIWRGHVKYAPKFEKLPVVINTAEKCSNTKDRDDEPKSTEDKDKAQRIIDYTFGKGEYPSDIIAEFQSALEAELTRERLINAESNRKNTKSNANESNAKSEKHIQYASTTHKQTQSDDERLVQKIEKIDETPLVPTEPPKIEDVDDLKTPPLLGHTSKYHQEQSTNEPLKSQDNRTKCLTAEEVADAIKNLTVRPGSYMDYTKPSVEPSHPDPKKHVKILFSDPERNVDEFISPEYGDITKVKLTEREEALIREIEKISVKEKLPPFAPGNEIIEDHNGNTVDRENSRLGATDEISDEQENSASGVESHKMMPQYGERPEDQRVLVYQSKADGFQSHTRDLDYNFYLKIKEQNEYTRNMKPRMQCPEISHKHEQTGEEKHLFMENETKDHGETSTPKDNEEVVPKTNKYFKESPSDYFFDKASQTEHIYPKQWKWLGPSDPLSDVFYEEKLAMFESGNVEKDATNNNKSKKPIGKNNSKPTTHVKPNGDQFDIFPSTTISKTGESFVNDDKDIKDKTENKQGEPTKDRKAQSFNDNYYQLCNRKYYYPTTGFDNNHDPQLSNNLARKNVYLSENPQENMTQHKQYMNTPEILGPDTVNDTQSYQDITPENINSTQISQEHDILPEAHVAKTRQDETRKKINAILGAAGVDGDKLDFSKITPAAIEKYITKKINQSSNHRQSETPKVNYHNTHNNSCNDNLQQNLALLSEDTEQSFLQQNEKPATDLYYVCATQPSQKLRQNYDFSNKNYNKNKDDNTNVLTNNMVSKTETIENDRNYRDEITEPMTLKEELHNFSSLEFTKPFTQPETSSYTSPIALSKLNDPHYRDNNPLFKERNKPLTLEKTNSKLHTTKLQYLQEQIIPKPIRKSNGIYLRDIVEDLRIPPKAVSKNSQLIIKEQENPELSLVPMLYTNMTIQKDPVQDPTKQQQTENSNTKECIKNNEIYTNYLKMREKNKLEMLSYAKKTVNASGSEVIAAEANTSIENNSSKEQEKHHKALQYYTDSKHQNFVENDNQPSMSSGTFEGHDNTVGIITSGKLNNDLNNETQFTNKCPSKEEVNNYCVEGGICLDIASPVLNPNTDCYIYKITKKYKQHGEEMKTMNQTEPCKGTVTSDLSAVTATNDLQNAFDSTKKMHAKHEIPAKLAAETVLNQFDAKNYFYNNHYSNSHFTKAVISPNHGTSSKDTTVTNKDNNISIPLQTAQKSLDQSLRENIHSLQTQTSPPCNVYEHKEKPETTPENSHSSSKILNNQKSERHWPPPRYQLYVSKQNNCSSYFDRLNQYYNQQYIQAHYRRPLTNQWNHMSQCNETAIKWPSYYQYVYPKKNPQQFNQSLNTTEVETEITDETNSTNQTNAQNQTTKQFSNIPYYQYQVPFIGQRQEMPKLGATTNYSIYQYNNQHYIPNQYRTTTDTPQNEMDEEEIEGRTEPENVVVSNHQKASAMCEPSEKPYYAHILDISVIKNYDDEITSQHSKNTLEKTTEMIINCNERNFLASEYTLAKHKNTPDILAKYKKAQEKRNDLKFNNNKSNEVPMKISDILAKHRKLLKEKLEKNKSSETYLELSGSNIVIPEAKSYLNNSNHVHSYQESHTSEGKQAEPSENKPHYAKMMETKINQTTYDVSKDKIIDTSVNQKKLHGEKSRIKDDDDESPKPSPGPSPPINASAAATVMTAARIQQPVASESCADRCSKVNVEFSFPIKPGLPIYYERLGHIIEGKKRTQTFPKQEHHQSSLDFESQRTANSCSPKIDINETPSTTKTPLKYYERLGQLIEPVTQSRPRISQHIEAKLISVETKPKLEIRVKSENIITSGKKPKKLEKLDDDDEIKIEPMVEKEAIITDYQPPLHIKAIKISKISLKSETEPDKHSKDAINDKQLKNYSRTVMNSNNLKNYTPICSGGEIVLTRNQPQKYADKLNTKSEQLSPTHGDDYEITIVEEQLDQEINKHLDKSKSETETVLQRTSFDPVNLKISNTNTKTESLTPNTDTSEMKKVLDLDDQNNQVIQQDDNICEKIQMNIATHVGPLPTVKHDPVKLSSLLEEIRLRSQLEAIEDIEMDMMPEERLNAELIGKCGIKEIISKSKCNHSEESISEMNSTKENSKEMRKCGDKKTCPPPQPECPKPKCPKSKPSKCPPKGPPPCPPPKCPPPPPPKCPPAPRPAKCPPPPPPPPKCPPQPPACPTKEPPCDPCAPPKKYSVGTTDWQTSPDVIFKETLTFLNAWPIIVHKRSNQGEHTCQSNCDAGFSGIDLLQGFRGYEPWSPIPCWPLPKKVKKISHQEKCPQPPPKNYGSCEPKQSPCQGFPKRLTCSSLTDINENTNVE